MLAEGALHFLRAAVNANRRKTYIHQIAGVSFASRCDGLLLSAHLVAMASEECKSDLGDGDDVLLRIQRHTRFRYHFDMLRDTLRNTAYSVGVRVWCQLQRRCGVTWEDRCCVDIGCGSGLLVRSCVVMCVCVCVCGGGGGVW